jgi:hypothetical protein
MIRAMLVLAMSLAAAAPKPSSVVFLGEEYFHRWSMNGQNEYTPKGSEDLSAWSNMLTINSTPIDPTRMPELASTIRANYEKAGATILRVDSADGPGGKTEYFQAAVFTTATFMEASLTRVFLAEGRPLIATYGKRFYGADVSAQMSAWLKQNSPSVEKNLRTWTGAPSRKALEALPQATK